MSVVLIYKAQIRASQVHHWSFISVYVEALISILKWFSVYSRDL